MAMGKVEILANRLKHHFRDDPHYDKADAMAEIDCVLQPLVGALEMIAEADETSTLAGAVAIAKHALESLK